MFLLREACRHQPPILTNPPTTASHSHQCLERGRGAPVHDTLTCLCSGMVRKLVTLASVVSIHSRLYACVYMIVYMYLCALLSTFVNACCWYNPAAANGCGCVPFSFSVQRIMIPMILAQWCAGACGQRTDACRIHCVPGSAIHPCE